MTAPQVLKKLRKLPPHRHRLSPTGGGISHVDIIAVRIRFPILEHLRGSLGAIHVLTAARWNDSEMRWRCPSQSWWMAYTWRCPREEGSGREDDTIDTGILSTFRLSGSNSASQERSCTSQNTSLNLLGRFHALHLRFPSKLFLPTLLPLNPTCTSSSPASLSQYDLMPRPHVIPDYYLLPSYPQPAILTHISLSTLATKLQIKLCRSRVNGGRSEGYPRISTRIETAARQGCGTVSLGYMEIRVKIRKRDELYEGSARGDSWLG